MKSYHHEGKKHSILDNFISQNPDRYPEYWLVLSLAMLCMVLVSLMVGVGDTYRGLVAISQEASASQFIQAPRFSLDHILVKVKPGVNPNKVASSHQLQSTDNIIDQGSDALELQDLYIMKLPSSVGLIDLNEKLNALKRDSRVLYAEKDYDLDITNIPNDPSFGVQYGFNNTGLSGGVVDSDIDAPEAWDVTTGTGTSLVAVIDTGVDYNHVDLASNIWINSGEIPNNGVDDDHDGYIDDIHGYDFANNDGDPMDDNGHGTHVAGTIGSLSNNSIGVAGVDWNVKIMVLKFIGSSGTGSTSNAIKALNFAVSKGAIVSNNSWGGGGYNQSLYDAINSAKSKNHIFVAAAGNSGTNNDTTVFYPASYNLDNIISVAASDRIDHLALFSNYGVTSVDLAAPGMSIYSTIPNNSYGYKSGTSMATPHVTGAVALVRDLYPDWNYQQTINQIFTTTDILPALVGRVTTNGRLNLGRALGVNQAQPNINIGASFNNSLLEGNTGTTNRDFNVCLTQASTQTVTVNWATADGTATVADNDYVASNGSLTFNPGIICKTITILITGDTTPELTDAMYVDLSNAVNATIRASRSGASIINDDAPLAPPTITFNSPSDGATISGTAATVKTTATSSVGFGKIENYVDGVFKWTCSGSAVSTTLTCSFSLDTTKYANGSHVIMAKVYDSYGTSPSSTSINVTISNGGGGDTIAPTVSITSPSAGATISGTTSVAVSASDNIGVTKVELYVDSVLKYTSTAAPYNFSWNTATVANGSHNLTAKAYDAANNVTTSAIVTVSIDNPVDTTSPTVSLSGPSTVTNKNKTFTATASDNIGIAKVEFYVDNKLLATDTSSPYMYAVNIQKTTAGTHTIFSKAYDTSNNTAISNTITFTK